MAKRLSGEIPDKFAGTINAQALRSIVERAAHVMEQQQQLAEDLNGICKEGDEAGVASKREIRRLAREQLMDPEVLDSQLTRMIDLRAALRDYASTPLGGAAIEREEASAHTDAMAAALAEKTAKKRKPFAEQPVKRGRGRPKKNNGHNPFAAARRHLGDEPPF